MSFSSESNYLSGMRDSVANILGAHIKDMNFALLHGKNAPGSGHEVENGMAMFGAKDLSYVLLDTERDGGAYQTLLTDQAGYMRKDINAGATEPGSYEEQIQQLRTRAGNDGYVLGYLLQARDEALVGDGKAADAANGAMADIVKKGLGLITVPGGSVGSLASDEFGTWLTDHMRTHEEIDAYGKADSYKLQNQTLVNQMVESTLIQHNIWPADHQPPTPPSYLDPTTHQPIPPDRLTGTQLHSYQAWMNNHSFIDPTTHGIIPADKMTPAQLDAFRTWAQTSGSVPDVEQQAGGTNHDGQSDYKDWLGIDT